MANVVNKFIGVAGAVMRNYIIADADAAKPNGTNVGDWCYAIDTDAFYVWDGAAWDSF